METNSETQVKTDTTDTVEIKDVPNIELPEGLKLDLESQSEEIEKKLYEKVEKNIKENYVAKSDIASYVVAVINALNRNKITSSKQAVEQPKTTEQINNEAISELFAKMKAEGQIK